MKLSIISVTMLVSVRSLLGASDRPGPQFPDAVVTINTAEKGRSVSTPVLQAPDWRGGILKKQGFPGQAPLLTEPLTWQYVGRSDFGDVYVVSLQQFTDTPEVVPLVFDGRTALTLTRGSVVLRIGLPSK